MRALAYDSVNHVWTDICATKQFRTNFALINFRERLYIFGGRIEERRATGRVEVYCPENNEWEFLSDLPFLYQQPHAVILNDKIIVYDECPGAVPDSRLPPCTWNEETETWDVEKLFSPYNKIHLYQFCCVDDRRTLKELSNENKNLKSIWSKSSFDD